MKTLTLVSFIVLIINTITAQNKPDAKAILDKASNINNAYKTISSDFLFMTGSVQQPESSVSEKGKIEIKGQKYRLTLDKSIITFDGKCVYNYSPESNEVNITNPEPTKAEKGDFFISNPRDIFSFYTKNFKYKWITETNLKGKACHEIDLYPVDLKTKYVRFTMHIEKSTYQIVDIVLVYKNGDRHSVEFSNFVVNKVISDEAFNFDSKKYPGIVVNDMRF